MEIRRPVLKMFKCEECHRRFCKASEIQAHLKYIHNFGNAHFPISICPYHTCVAQLHSWSGFLRHIRSHELISSKLCDVNINDANAFVPPDNTINELQDDGFGEDINSCRTSVNSCIDIMKNILSSFCSSLLATGVTNSTVDVVVKDLENSFAQFSKIICNLGKPFCNENYEEFSCQVMSLLGAFSHVRTMYLRQKIFEKNDNLILPKELSLGSRTELRVRYNKRQQVIVSDTFMYVPIIKTLEKIISCPAHFKYFSNGENSNCITTFADTISFKNNSLFQKHTKSLQIQLFYDDFETVNPLGSKRGVHKLGAFYFTVKNFPDFVNSRLSEIHLLALFYSEDAKKYGINSILRLILPDLLKLETTGIKINKLDTIFGTLCSLSFDNLGGNSLLGFTESFNAHYYCRICCTSKFEAQELFDHNLMIIRNKTSHSQHVNEKSLGVQSECVLNELQYFNFLDSPSVDIMHDLLEGVVPYEIKLVLQKLINLGCLNLQTINQRLLAHDFGYLESKNRPSPIRLDGVGNKIGQKAAQCWCLIRFIPVIIGDLILDEHKMYWELLLLLLDIMSYAFCRKFTDAILHMMDKTIIHHHKLFRKLFPNEKLIPKHHFMCHYSYVIRQSGPLVSLWAMRYEGKHYYFSQLAGQIKNFRNICYSLTMRHQQYSSHAFKSFDINEGIRAEHIISAKLSQFFESFDLIEKLRSLDLFESCDGDTEVLTANQVRYRGYDYRLDYVVCYDLGEVFPKFGIICEFILVDETRCLLLVKQLNVTYFDRHFYSFIVTQSDNLYELVDISSLVIHDCVELQKNCKQDSLHLVLRHYL